MAEMFSLDQAQRYYDVATINRVKRLPPEYFPFDQILALLNQSYLVENSKTVSQVKILSISDEMFTRSINNLRERGGCIILEDDYAPKYVKFIHEKLSAGSPGGPHDLLMSRYEEIGSKADEWLGSALLKIAETLDQKINKDHPPPGSTDSLDHNWEPLPINRSDENFEEAIRLSEDALKEIETSNGYASQSPEERNGIVETIKGTIKAIKEGSPSRNAIKQGLLAPLQYIARKFSDSALGETAKVAVIAIIKWLSS